MVDYLHSITLQNQHPHDVVRLAQSDRGAVTARDRARGQHVHPGRGRPARNPAVWRRGHPSPTQGGRPRAAGGRDANQRNKNKGSKERRQVIFALGNNRMCFHKSIALPE